MDNLRLKFDFNNMMNDFMGENGISEKEIENLMPKIKKAHEAMIEKRKHGKMDWRDLPV